MATWWMYACCEAGRTDHVTTRCEVTLLGVAEEMYGHLVDVRMLRGREDESCDHEVGCVCM